MRKILKWLIFGFAVCGFLAADAAMAANGLPDRQEARAQFQSAISQSVQKLRGLAGGRAGRNTPRRRSIELTVQAVDLLAKSQNFPGAEALLSQAIEHDRHNLLALVILADVLDKQGKTDSANQRYREFLEELDKLSMLNRGVMDLASRYAFSHYVYRLLSDRGIDVPTPRMMERVPLMAKLSWEKTSFLRDLIATGLPIGVTLGLLLIIVRQIFLINGPDPSIWDNFMIRIYGVLVTGYLLWILHLFVNIPALIEPVEQEIMVVILAGFTIVVFLQIQTIRTERKRDLDDPSLMPCPHCKKLILKLAAICNHCQKKL